MSPGLFRQEALDQQGERLKGSVILSQPISYALITLFITLITALAFIFLLRNDYSRKQAVSGYLSPDQGLISISAPKGGRIIDVSVSQDQDVQEGDSLFKVQVEQTVSGGGLISEQTLKNTEAQVQKIKQRIYFEQERGVLVDVQFQENMHVILVEINQSKELMVGERALLTLKTTALNRAKILFDQGLLSSADFDDVKSSYLVQENKLNTLLFAIHDKQASLTKATLEKDAEFLFHKNEINVLETRLTELQGQLIRLNGDNKNHIISPAKGKIANINNQVGQVVDPIEQVVAIIPHGSLLQAELYVPSRAIGFLKEGQQVVLRYEAFPYQKFGVHKASVSSISKTIIFPEELPQNYAFSEPVYRVIASLDSQNVQAFGSDIPLRSGMLLSADILLEERSLFEWLLEPLFSIKGKR